MRIAFPDKKLEELYTLGKGEQRLDPAVFEAYMEVVAAIQAAADTRDLRGLMSLHYEKLKGDRAGDRSLRLHRGWRLIVREAHDEHGTYIEIVKIDDYHRRER